MAKRNSAGYHVLASVYDRWQDTYGRDFTAVILPRFLASIRKFRIPVSTFLDIGCGTGTLVLAMAERGWNALGVDASAEMVRVAESKCNEAGLHAQCMQQDMRSLRVSRRVRLAAAMFDTLNHVSSTEELLATFRAVYAALLPGGYFMFDLNNEHCYATLWTQEEVIRHKDFTLFLRNSFDAATGRARSQVTLTPRGGKEQMSEVVEEVLFPAAQVRALLEQAGFQICLSEEFSFPDVPEAGLLKSWWVAMRPKSTRKRISDI